MYGSEPSLPSAELHSECTPRRFLSTLSALSTIVALLLGIACVVWLRGPETAPPNTTVALLGPRASSAPTAAVTGETRRLQAQVHMGAEAEVGSDLADMARSILGRVSRF
jgi:hypothetical protein